LLKKGRETFVKEVYAPTSEISRIGFYDYMSELVYRVYRDRIVDSPVCGKVKTRAFVGASSTIFLPNPDWNPFVARIFHPGGV
jgi:hypothetical protein